MNGEYTSLADACGERTFGPYDGGWVSGVDFDPADPDEMEVMRLVWAREESDRVRLLEDENRRLRTMLADLTAE